MALFATYPDLKGKVALIMGIGQIALPHADSWGNGAAIARVLSYNGVKIFGCDLKLEAAEFTAERLRKDNKDAICNVMAANVTKPEEVQKVVDAVMEKYGKIDILVCNVGMTAPGSPSTMSEGVWDQQIELNLKTVYLSCHVVLPIMEKQGFGNVVTNGSLTAVRYIGKHQIGYAAAKAAVVQFTKASACMYAAKGLRLNCLIPGLILTPLVENLGASDKEADREVYRQITEHNVPMGCMGTAFDVANAAAFLVSDSARYITGHALVIDGGLTLSTGTGT